MLAPWQADQPVEMSRAELEKRVDRRLTRKDVETLTGARHRLRDRGDRYQVAVSQLSIGLGLLDLGFPVEAARAAAEVYTKHGQEIAHELYDVFRRMVWPVYKESGASPETVQGVVERLKPLSIASLVSAYEAGMDQTRIRENIDRDQGRGA